jgi:hypothetical protein
MIKLPSSDVDRNLDARLRDLYRKEPYQVGLESIAFSRAFKNPINESLYYVYSVEYVSDREVVYHLTKEGNLQDRFMISFWGGGEGAKCVP